MSTIVTKNYEIHVRKKKYYRLYITQPFIKEYFKTCTFTASLTNALEVSLQSSSVFSIFLECW